MENCKEASTPMSTSSYMDADSAGKVVDQTKIQRVDWILVISHY